MTSETTRVVIEDIRAEAGKWRELSDAMDGVYQNPVGNQGLALNANAFFLGPTELVATAMHAKAYNGYYDHIQKLIAGAVAEWDQIGAALDRTADEFERTDQTAKVDLEKTYTQP